jgi:hypothetical protein
MSSNNSASSSSSLAERQESPTPQFFQDSSDPWKVVSTFITSPKISRTSLRKCPPVEEILSNIRAESEMQMESQPATLTTEDTSTRRDSFSSQGQDEIKHDESWDASNKGLLNANQPSLESLSNSSTIDASKPSVPDTNYVSPSSSTESTGSESDEQSTDLSSTMRVSEKLVKLHDDSGFLDTDDAKALCADPKT